MCGSGNVHYVPAATGSDTSAAGYAPPSSSGLGHHPFKVVRIPRDVWSLNYSGLVAAMGRYRTRRRSRLPHMLLDMAWTELLLAKDYPPLSAQRRTEVIREFIQWASEQGITQVDDVTAGIVRRYIAYLRERPNSRYGGKLSGETQHSRASIIRMCFISICTLRSRTRRN